MEASEPRPRRLGGCGRPEELKVSPALSTKSLPTASGDGHLGAPDGQHVPSRPQEAAPTRETALTICLQVTLPFVLAGLGLSWAGVLLNYFQVRKRAQAGSWPRGQAASTPGQIPLGPVRGTRGDPSGASEDSRGAAQVCCPSDAGGRGQSTASNMVVPSLKIVFFLVPGMEPRDP
uniref:Uncharacterized protein n=1 Tax=Spermophilus dauricus TaxID=99837 RepID=A0A8C9QCN9_SPEDA